MIAEEKYTRRRLCCFSKWLHLNEQGAGDGRSPGLVFLIGFFYYHF